MAVAGEAKLEGQRGELIGAAGKSFQRGAKAQPGQVAMDGNAGSLLKDPGEMKGRCVYRSGELVERDAFTQPAREVGFGRLGAVGVIGVRALATAPARHAVSRKCSLEQMGHELKCRHIGPERFEWIGSSGLELLHELAVPPEHAGIAGAGDEGKRPLGAVVDGGIELADDLAEHARRGANTVPRSPQSAGWLTR